MALPQGYVYAMRGGRALIASVHETARARCAGARTDVVFASPRQQRAPDLVAEQLVGRLLVGSHRRRLVRAAVAGDGAVGQRAAEGVVRRDDHPTALERQ